jgi:hypothetical protein
MKADAMTVIGGCGTVGKFDVDPIRVSRTRRERCDDIV